MFVCISIHMVKKDSQNPVRIHTYFPTVSLHTKAKKKRHRFEGAAVPCEFCEIRSLVGRLHISDGCKSHKLREKPLRPTCNKVAMLCEGCFSLQGTKVQTLSMMSGVIMTCMSDLRPGFVGSIATAGVGNMLVKITDAYATA